MDLGAGECFGEDFICFGKANYYGVKVESFKVTLLSIDKQKFHEKYKRMLIPL